MSNTVAAGNNINKEGCMPDGFGTTSSPGTIKMWNELDEPGTIERMRNEIHHLTRITSKMEEIINKLKVHHHSPVSGDPMIKISFFGDSTASSIPGYF